MQKDLSFIFLIFLSSCTEISSVPGSRQELSYENIAIYSDLSSRMNSKPNDKAVILQILNYFLDDCVKPGLKVNDRSKIFFSRLNRFSSNCRSTSIDIESIENLTEKQEYVNNRATGDSNLNADVQRFKDQLDCNYDESDSGGLDVLSLLINEINSGNNIKQNFNICGESDTTIITYVHHIFIFTSGYLEFNQKSGDLGLYFGENDIERLRQISLLQKRSVKEILIRCPDLRLKPLKSNINQKVNLFVMETDDRGINEKTGTFKHVGELSDNQILRTVWELWAAESGFNSFTWKARTRPGNLPTDYIKTIISAVKGAEPLALPSDFVGFGFSGDCKEPRVQRLLQTEVQKKRNPGSEQQSEKENSVQQLTELSYSINSTVFQTTYLKELPNNSSKTIQKVVIGTAIQVIGFTEDYWKVLCGNQIGFLRQNHVFINDDLRAIKK
jgi:hypothetical protein